MNETTAIEEENMEYNKNMLKHLQEMQKKREEKKAYEEAFNKLSNGERLIIRKVEAELKSVYDMDIINYYQYIHPEIKEKEKVQREKEEIKRLTKLIEDNRKKGKEYNKIIPIGAFIGLGVLAVITGI